MVEVKTASLLVNKLSCLMNMIAQHLSECVLEKVGCCMVTHDSHSAILFNLSDNIVALGKAALLYCCDVEEVSLGLDGIVNSSDICAIEEHTSIAYLSAALSIERSYIKNDNYIITLNSGLYLNTVSVDSKYLSFVGFKICIACEYSCGSVYLYAVVSP